MWRRSVCLTLLFLCSSTDGNEDQNQQRSPRQPRQFPRLNLGSILGEIDKLAAQSGNKRPSSANNPLGEVIGGLLGNVNVGFNQDGTLQIGIGSPTPAPLSAPPTVGPPSTFPPFVPPPTTVPPSAPSPPIFPPSPPPRPGKCFEKNVEYLGEDLLIRKNGIRNKQPNKRLCQTSCQDTEGCEYWVYVNRRTNERNLRRACYLKSNKYASQDKGRRFSGPKFCDGEGPITGGGGGGSTSSPFTSCRTNGGANFDATCQFPFQFNDRVFNGCTKLGANDGKFWCSTKVTTSGLHVSGQGQWGHCQENRCPIDHAGSPQLSTQPPPLPTPPPPPIGTPPPPPQRCGGNAKRFQTKIVGGRPADPEEWPWLAALIRPSNSSGQYCGATLISDRFILTAAHCVAPFSQNQIKVTLGEYNFEQQGETEDRTYKLSGMKMHESYHRKTFENDIALLKLDKPVQFTKSIYPICLPPRGRDYENTRGYVIGWGTIYFGGPTSSLLQEVNVRVWNNRECSANYARLNRKVADTMLCAGEEGRDACQGDSGGPLNCLDLPSTKWELCGIVSWGARCAEPDFPGVYTKTTEYLDWIHNNMNTI